MAAVQRDFPRITRNLVYSAAIYKAAQHSGHVRVYMKLYIMVVVIQFDRQLIMTLNNLWQNWRMS